MAMLLCGLSQPVCFFQMFKLVLEKAEGFRLLARRRQRCNFLRSSRIRAHLTPAASTMPLKFDPNEIKVMYLRCTSG